ncbi:MAG: D-hexose-6-phosphate mutarotase [Proteobacteria bacterium]|nr:D-hexose-6-phosphate mutarotase [Pseudomonadota bacterium]
MVDRLHNQFAIDQRVQIHGGPQGLPVVELSHQNGDVVILALHGAHVLSWRHAGVERLYMSPRATFEPGKAIRGGVPIIFPQFGPGPLPTHGFGRNRSWQLLASAAGTDGSVSVRLGLDSSEETLTLWKNRFHAELEISLANSLDFNLTVHNLDAAPFEFQFAFHTYFKVSHISQVRIHGLQNLTYLNNLRQRAQELEDAATLSIRGEIDRVYLNAPNPTILEDLHTMAGVHLSKRALADVVVWNPWIAKSATLVDLEPEAYLQFVCIETGAIGTPIQVLPGEFKSCGQTLWGSPLPDHHP